MTTFQEALISQQLLALLLVYQTAINRVKMSSAVGQTTDKRPGHSGQPKTKLGFEISKPIQIGHLRKLGEKGLKSFKRRFFVLYPNFLVYYADAVDWESDKTFQAFRVSAIIFYLAT